MRSLGRIALTLVVALGFAGACSGDESMDIGGEPGKAGALNVSQGGPQDIALFRKLVEEGEVPSPDMLDPVGFFAEHAVDLPPADCGSDVCVQPMLSVMPRFNGGNWTMAFVAMNTPLDPATLPRPPLHLVMAVEATPGSLESLRPQLGAGLGGVAAKLRDGDRMTLVSYAGDVITHTFFAEPDEAVAQQWAMSLAPREPESDLYAGLAAADRAIGAAAGFEGVHRVLLVTTGRATSGVTDPDRIVRLGEGMARKGVALNIVGLSEFYESRLPAALGSLGAGTYAFATDATDLLEVLQLAADTTLFPLATNFRLTLEPAPGYRIGRIYGARRAWAHPSLAVLDLPALFIGRREGADDTGGGRRGGGGGLFVELLADPQAGVPANAPAFRVEASWDEASGPMSSSREVLNELGPGVNPLPPWPSFSQPDYGKPFMMLNMYLALRATADLFEGGECARAAGVIDMMAPSIQGWQNIYADPDITADQNLLLQLGQNVVGHCLARGPVQPTPPYDIDAGCGFI